MSIINSHRLALLYYDYEKSDTILRTLHELNKTMERVEMLCSPSSSTCELSATSLMFLDFHNITYCLVVFMLQYCFVE